MDRKSDLLIRKNAKENLLPNASYKNLYYYCAMYIFYTYNAYLIINSTCLEGVSCNHPTSVINKV